MSDVRPPRFWRLRVRDDGGSYRPLDFRQWKRSDAARDPLTKEPMWYARRAIKIPWWVIAGLVVFPFVPGALGGSGISAVGLIFYGAVLCVLYAMFSPIVRRARAHRVIPFMRTWKLCASCAYQMDGVPPDANGLAMCPECGAKWRFASGAPSPGRVDAATLSLGGEREGDA